MHTRGQNSPGNETDSIAQIAALSKRRFDGIIMNASHQEVINLEVKLTSDRLPDYWIREHQRVQRQCSSKIAKYRELDRDHRRQLDFLPAIASTSGRIHCELLRLLFLHAHRETTRFFEIFDDGHARERERGRLFERETEHLWLRQRNHTPLGSLTAALPSLIRSGPTSTSTAARSRPASTAPPTSFMPVPPTFTSQ